MRFELVVWREAKPISRERAAETWGELERGGDVAPYPGVGEFAGALSGEFPGVDVVTRPGHAVVTMEPEDVDRVSAGVFSLAREHGLVCYDPVRDLVHNLEPVGAYPGMELRTGDGMIIVDPDLGLVHDVLATMSPQNPFVTLVSFGLHFLQVSPERQGFELEYKDSVAGRMYRTPISELAEIQRSFSEYATGDRGFLNRHSWTS